jgi:predicted transport protein
MERLGNEVARSIDWHYPRLVCIAGDFTKHDEHAIQQIPRNIDLIRYRRFGDDLILLEQVAKNSIAPTGKERKVAAKRGQQLGDVDPAPSQNASFAVQRLSQSSQEVQDWYDRLKAHALGLGDGVEERILGDYIAFRDVKNFAFFRFRPSLNRIVIGMRVRSGHKLGLESDFLTKVEEDKGIEIHVDSLEDVVRAEFLLTQAHQER